MARLPFGGFDATEKLIRLTAKPARYLKEISELEPGQIMRPALARWLYAVWRAGYMRVTPTGGRPLGEKPERIYAAVAAIDAHVAVGRLTAQAIDAVIVEMSLEVGRSAVYGWLKRRDEQRASGQVAPLPLEDDAWKMSELAACALNGESPSAPLLQWFRKRLLAGRLIVDAPTDQGRPSAVPHELKDDAVRLVRRLLDRGQNISDATRRVAKRLGYVAQARTVRGWLDKDAKQREVVAGETREQLRKEQHLLALSLFRELEEQGVGDQDAISTVEDRFANQGVPSESVLRAWQIASKI